MSVSGIINSTSNDPDYKDKIFPELIAWAGDPHANIALGAVLQNGNSAFIPGTTTAQDATDFNILGCVKIETGTIGMGNQPALVVGEPGDILQIKGGTALGSILVGNGADTEELPCPTTATTETTSDIYNWLSLANGQSKTFGVTNASLYQLGYSITILYSGTDSITGTITAIGVGSITITITSFASQVYTSAPLITTTLPDPATATSGGGDPVFIFNGATTTPNPPDIPPNSFLLSGTCYLYAAPAQPPLNITLTAINFASALVNATTSIFSIPVYELPPVSTTAFTWGSAGCFFPAGGEISLASNTGGNQIAFGFPTGGSFINQNFTGSVSGYTLAYSSGTITINSKLVLTADNTKPLGVFWGVDAQGVGTITSVSAGNNISISGSLSAPVVNVANPLTSNLVLGTGVSLIGTQGQNEMEISALGLVDSYTSGLIENKEEISVTSANVIETISTTDGTTYQNSAITTCSNGSVGEIMTANNLSTTETGATTIQVLPTSCIMGVGCSITGSPANTDGSVILSTTTTNPVIQLSQSAPFATSYITTIDRDGIIQNNSGGSGFRCRSAQDIFLEPTNGQPNPQLGVIRVPNGNSINMSVDTYTTAYRKDGVGIRDTFAPSSYDGTADFYSTGGTSEMKLESDFIGTSEHSLSCKVALTGDATIAHATTSGTTRNLAITSGGNMSLTAVGNATLQGSGSNVVCSATSIIGTTQVFQNFSSQSGTAATPNFIFKEAAPTAVGACVIRMDKAVAPTAGNAISAISSYALDGTATSREWSRIQTKVENVGAGNQDATLSIFNSVNGVVSETFNFNGSQNENNSFRPLDMNNNEIRSNNGNLTLTTTASSGTGLITMAAKADVDITGTSCSMLSQSGVNVGAVYTNPGVVELEASTILGFTGAALQSGTSGGNSGQHLRINLNGTFYKIKLEND